MSQTKPLTARQRYWSEHLESCSASGQTLKAYAVAHGLDAQSLYRAKSMLRARTGAQRSTQTVSKTAATFVRVDTTDASSLDTMCRVRFRNGVTVDVDCAPAQWSSLLSVIAQLP